MPNETMLTTYDNPYSPFTQFTKWYMFDVDHGYNTCGKIARIARVSDEMSDQEYDDAIDLAVNSLLKNDFLDIYTKVYRDEAKKAPQTH